MIFSERLKSLRKEKGLTQEQLAEELNVSRQAVSKWESGQTYPEIEKLIILSDLFGITLEELVKDKNIGSAGSNVTDNIEGGTMGNFSEKRKEEELIAATIKLDVDKMLDETINSISLESVSGEEKNFAKTLISVIIGFTIFLLLLNVNDGLAAKLIKIPLIGRIVDFLTL